jgi:hypothetical protein
MRLRAACFAVLLVLGAAGAPGGERPSAGPLGDSRPTLSVCDAVRTAESFVADRRSDLSGQYIHSVILSYDEKDAARGRYWRVQWMHARPALGGEYGLRVYQDGSVRPDPLGP